MTADWQGRTFDYDGENHQTSFDAGAATYSYDGDGQRVRKTDSSGTTLFVYDAMGRLAAEYTTAAPAANGTSYLTQDTLGSTRVVTDSNEAVKARHDYLPFGEELPSTVGVRSNIAGYAVSDQTRQRFTSYERDTESGLDYAQARYYSGAQGRFTSTDPLLASGIQANPKTWNRYTYALNNPLKFVDPSGLAPETPQMDTRDYSPDEPMDGIDSRYFYRAGSSTHDSSPSTGDMAGSQEGEAIEQNDGDAKERSDLKGDSRAFKNKPAPKHPGLPNCAKNYLSVFFNRSLLDAITWGHGIPWFVPMDAVAFTLDDQIYFVEASFNTLNGISIDEIVLLGHEITHSQQYRRNGSLRQKRATF